MRARFSRREHVARATNVHLAHPLPRRAPRGHGPRRMEHHVAPREGLPNEGGVADVPEVPFNVIQPEDGMGVGWP